MKARTIINLFKPIYHYTVGGGDGRRGAALEHFTHDRRIPGGKDGEEERGGKRCEEEVGRGGKMGKRWKDDFIG